MILYRILSILLFPCIVVIMFIRFIQGKETIVSLTHKFAIKYNYPKKDKTVIWFHAASIGEVNLAIPIIKMI